MVTLGWPLAALLIVLTAAAATVTQLAGLGDARGVVIAAIRAVAQLAAVSLVIGFVLRSLALTALFLMLMVLVAAGTSAHRITGSCALGRGGPRCRFSAACCQRWAPSCSAPRCRWNRSRSCRLPAS